MVGQMDSVQDGAAMAVLVFSSDYLKSPYCIHEMERATRRDSDVYPWNCFSPSKQFNVRCLPGIGVPNPLYVDLQDDGKADQWRLLLQSCGAELSPRVSM